MKTLYLIRHAKSSWHTAASSDFARPLNERGERDAPLMAARLAERGASPDAIVSSPAERARATAACMARGVGFDESRIRYDEFLYSSALSDLHVVLGSIDDACEEIFLVGHNWSITELAEELSGEHLEKIPTAGVVGLRCAVESWKDVSPGCCSLLFFDYPKKDREAE